MNLPNKLTMLRVLLIPVFMVCAANRWMLAARHYFRRCEPYRLL